MTLHLLCLLLVAPPEDLAEKYRADRAEAERSGATRVLPVRPLARADELARSAEAALRANRPAEAARLYREARWALPALPTDAPPHLARVLGDPRLRHVSWVEAVAYSANGSL